MKQYHSLCHKSIHHPPNFAIIIIIIIIIVIYDKNELLHFWPHLWLYKLKLAKAVIIHITKMLLISQRNYLRIKITLMLQCSIYKHHYLFSSHTWMMWNTALTLKTRIYAEIIQGVTFVVCSIRSSSWIPIG